MTAYVAPIAFMEDTHCETFKAVGLKDEGREELHEVVEPASQPFQLASLQPGSPGQIESDRAQLEQVTECGQAY